MAESINLEFNFDGLTIFVPTSNIYHAIFPNAISKQAWKNPHLLPFCQIKSAFWKLVNSVIFFIHYFQPYDV